MTFGEAKDKIRENLFDYGITYFSKEDISDSIQDGYDEIVLYSECYERFKDVQVSELITSEGGASPWIKIRKLIPDYYRLLAVLNRQNKFVLDLVSDRDEDFFKLDWQLTERGTVSTGIINGPEWLALPNRYTDPTYKPLRIFYVALAPKLTLDSDVFKILHEYTKLIELYSTADLLEQNQEFIKASKYWADYDKLLEAYRTKIFLLSKADRIFTREDYPVH